MIYFIENLLSQEEISYLKALTDNFTISDSPEVRSKNHYLRHFIDEEKELLDFQQKVSNNVIEIFNLKYDINAMWINKVTPETNKDDKFHLDLSEITLVTFLNEGYEGGNFEYYDNKELKTITPKANLSILINNKLSHRVAPVAAGTRYSLVTFMDAVTKRQKSIL